MQKYYYQMGQCIFYTRIDIVRINRKYECENGYDLGDDMTGVFMTYL